MIDPVVGHKTFLTEDGEYRHEPLLASEADTLTAQIEASELRRNTLMPDEQSAIRLLFDAYIRLKELGWNDARYCPKDGSLFDAIELGSTGIHTTQYEGEWPSGAYWVHDHGDLWPSHPVLYRVRLEE